MATMKTARTLRDGPDGKQIGSAFVLWGQQVKELGRDQGWCKIELVDVDPKVEGWVPLETVDQTGTVGANAVGPIDKTVFAEECWLEAIYFGGNAHFLAIVAEMRSRTRDDSAGEGDDQRVGPYRFTVKQWNAAAIDDQFDLRFAESNINNWRIQCVVAALVTNRARKVLQDASSTVTAISLYNEWLKQIGETPPADQLALEEEMKTAIAATTGPYTTAGNALVDSQPAPIARPGNPEGGGQATAPADFGADTGKVATLLDFLGKAEANGNYNMMNGGSTANNLVGMTIDELMVFQRGNVSGKRTSAAGKYQIISKTLGGLKASMKLRGNELFDQAMQDRMACALLVQRGLNKRLAGKISKEAFANQVAMEWASMPVVTAIVGHNQFMLTPGQSYYAGVGNNAALVPVKAFCNALP